MLANAMAMNYGFAFRLSAYSFLRALLWVSFGAINSRLVVDSPHNSIYEEELNGETVLVHRHNACRAYPAERSGDHPVYGRIGRPLLLPGTNRTSSYVCTADEGSRRSLYSVCHGAGDAIKRFVANGLSGPDPERRVTLRFDYSGSEPIAVDQLDDRGIDEAVRILASNRIVRPVARLRPFAVLT
jgi:RNA-splicing ligase RtcB